MSWTRSIALSASWSSCAVIPVWGKDGMFGSRGEELLTCPRARNDIMEIERPKRRNRFVLFIVQF